MNIGTRPVPLQIVPLEEKHLAEAARLLAAQHRIDRAHNPRLPRQFEDESFDISRLQAARQAEGTSSVVALSGIRVVGFLQGRIRFAPPGSSAGFSWHPRSVSMFSEGHAVEPGFCREAYGAMYAALSPGWLSAGLFGHYVFLSAQDHAGIETWFSLGFGMAWTYAVRDTHPIPGMHDTQVEIGLAKSQDRERVMDLLDELYRYHAHPPCYLPYVPDTAAGFRADNEKAFDDPGTMYWVARHQERIIGALVVTLPDSSALAIRKPARAPYIHLVSTVEAMRGKGVGVALLNRMMEWARENCYSCCAVEWHTANLSAAYFWERCGFEPVTQALVRQVDERIAWAHG